MTRNRNLRQLLALDFDDMTTLQREERIATVQAHLEQTQITTQAVRSYLQQI